MKTLIAALLIGMAASSASADDLTTLRTRAVYVVYAQNYCAANLKWVYRTAASLQLAEAQHSNWLAVNYGVLNYVTKTAEGLSYVEKDKVCNDAMDFLRAEHALLSPERGDS